MAQNRKSPNQTATEIYYPQSESLLEMRPHAQFSDFSDCAEFVSRIRQCWKVAWCEKVQLVILIYG